MVRLNCVAVVDLAAHVLPGMVVRGGGGLVVVSSAAAWQPVPFMATYAATKAFELHFTEAIAEELRGTGVRALAVCPGPTRDRVHAVRPGSDGSHAVIPFDDVDLVVRATWRALAGGRSRAPTGIVARGSLLGGAPAAPRAGRARGRADPSTAPVIEGLGPPHLESPLCPRGHLL